MNVNLDQAAAGGRRASMVFCAVLAHAVTVPGLAAPPQTGVSQERPPALNAKPFSGIRFDFGPGKVRKGCVPVLPADIYSQEKGFGFEPGQQINGIERGGWNALRSDYCTSSRPFYFSVALPEGSYRVTVTLGDRKGESDTTIKTELRRLMLEHVHTARGDFATRAFTANVRTPAIAGSREVRLKKRERDNEMVNWDDKLTIEFNGDQPCVCGLDIEPADKLPVIYLLGDSTVCDQSGEPWNSWGQMLPRFFKPDVVVANHAESGESLRSSLSAGRLDKVAGLLKPGDYLFIQFGHNDMKDTATNALENYRSLLKQYVATARQKGAVPVLVTSMERKAGLDHETLGDYPKTVREVAAEDQVALIDLNLMSKAFYQALGPEKIDLAFQDGTHHNNYGSYELAKCVVQGIRDARLPLAKHIAVDFTGFDPHHPDAADAVRIPPSPRLDALKPLGD